VLTPKDHYQAEHDTAVLRCPRCNVADHFTLVKESYVDGMGYDCLAVRCDKCAAFIQVCGSVEWKKQVVKMARHE
jgi:hypothetical protein